MVATTRGFMPNSYRTNTGVDVENQIKRAGEQNKAYLEEAKALYKALKGRYEK